MRRNPRAQMPHEKVGVFRFLVGLAAGLLVVAGAARLGAQQPSIVRVSVDSAGNQANDDSFAPALSADGQVVAFKSKATNLTALNNPQDFFEVFVRDLTQNGTEPISVDPLGEFGEDNSFPPGISTDGELVGFASAAENLLGPGGDQNQSPDVFVRDRTTQSTERVSIGNGTSGGASTRDIAPSFSGDKTLVAFESTARLAPNDPHNGDIADAYVYNRNTHAIELMDVRTVTQDPEPAYAPAISFDGCIVAFVSVSQRLLPQGEDTDEKLDVYVRDRCAEPPFTQRVSVNRDGTSANLGDSQASLFPPSLNDDGNLVAFESDSRDLVNGDNNGVRDIFVRDRAAGHTDRISVNSYGFEGNGGSSHPSISGDGRYVVFASVATNFVPDDGPNSDIFIRDRLTDQTCRVSVGAVTMQTDGDSVNPVISRDGAWIAFESTATNLVDGDTNGKRDVFLVPNQVDLQECPPTPTPTSTPTSTATETPTPTPTPLPCTTTADCPEGLLCIDNQCVEPPSCTQDSDCPGDLICVDDKCQPSVSCTTSADCPAGHVCVDNNCVEPPPCTQDSDCPGDLICVDDKCQPPVSCTTSADCPAGHVCVDNNCVEPPPCTQDSDCPAGLVCIDQMCQVPVSCQSDADCPPGQMCDQQRNVCVAKATPTPTIGAPTPTRTPTTAVATRTPTTGGPTRTPTTSGPTRTPTGQSGGGGGGGGGCQIGAPSSGSFANPGFLALFGPLALLWWRRRRRS